VKEVTLPCWEVDLGEMAMQRSLMQRSFAWRTAAAESGYGFVS
jgi:hypothetical protein